MKPVVSSSVSSAGVALGGALDDRVKEYLKAKHELDLSCPANKYKQELHNLVRKYNL